MALRDTLIWESLIQSIAMFQETPSPARNNTRLHQSKHR